jgi:predicted ATPase
MRFLDLDPEAMRSPSQPGQTVLGDRGENLSSVLQGICEDGELKATLLGWLRALTPMDASDFEFRPDLSGRVLLYLLESGGHEVSALSASDGTLRFLALIAALLSPDSGRFYFFEEFDNGIQPSRLHLLIELVQQVCRTHAIQVVGTTHNPAMLTFLDNAARQDALLVYKSEGAPDSRVRPIADLPNVARVLENDDLGTLHSTGWLEDAAIFSEPELSDPTS